MHDVVSWEHKVRCCLAASAMVEWLPSCRRIISLATRLKSRLQNIKTTEHEHEHEHELCTDCLIATTVFVQDYMRTQAGCYCVKQFALHVLLFAAPVKFDPVVNAELSSLRNIWQQRCDLIVFHLIQLHARLYNMSQSQIYNSLLRTRLRAIRTLCRINEAHCWLDNKEQGAEKNR